MSAKLDSFEKILNLMDNAGTDGEAQAAASAFRRLLIKENMTEEEVRSRLSDRYVDTEVEMLIYVCQPHGKWYISEYATLLNLIANNNLTKWLVIDKGSGILVGRSQNIERTIEIFEKTKAAAGRMLKEARSDELSKVFKDNFGKSYLMGFTAGLHARYEVEKSYDSANETALVLSLEEENNDFIAAKFGKVTNKEPDRTRVNPIAWRQGMEAGKAYTDKERINE